MIAGAVILWPAARALRALSLGEDAAASMGVNLRALRLRLVLGTAALVGTAIFAAMALGIGLGTIFRFWAYRAFVFEGEPMDVDTSPLRDEDPPG